MPASLGAQRGDVVVGQRGQPVHVVADVAQDVLHGGAHFGLHQIQRELAGLTAFGEELGSSP
jgi:hypothetical protein